MYAQLKADQTPDTYWINAPITNVLNTNVQALLVYEEDKRPFHPPYRPYIRWQVSNDIIKYWQHRHGHGARPGRHHHKLRSIMLGHSGSHYLGARSIGVPEVELGKRQGDNATVVLDETKLIVSPF